LFIIVKITYPSCNI